MKSRTARKGFSFTEILFAVMILGIGFIMVAAMFPVALQQTENSTQETVGAALARTGARHVEQVAKNLWREQDNSLGLPFPTPQYSMLVPTFAKRLLEQNPESLFVMTRQNNPNAYVPTYLLNIVPPLAPLTITVPGQVWSFCDPRDWYVYRGPTGVVHHNQVLWSQVSHNMISSFDGRYAWIAFYKRDRVATSPSTAGGSVTITDVPTAQVFVFATQVRNSTVYAADVPNNAAPSDTTIVDPSFYTASLQASLTTVGFLPATKGSGLPAKVTFPNVQQPNNTENGIGRASEGAYILISDDSMQPNNSLHGLLNGHIYRLGTQDTTDPTGATWELAPGFSLSAVENDVIVPQMNLTGNAGFPAFIIGKGRDVENPGDPTKPNFAGPAQDIAVYTTFLQVNP